MSAENSTCVTIGGEEYCNVTIPWTPRVSEVGGIFAMVVPTLVLLFIVLFQFFVGIDDTDEGKEIPKKVMKSYKRNTRLLYIKDHVAKEEYAKLKTGDPDYVVNIDGEEIELPDSDDAEHSERVVKASDVQTAIKHRELLGCVTLPRPVGHVAMVWKLIMQPITIIAWSVVDVLADTYYFYQLERGGLVDNTITRNVHVNNAILAFAVLGAWAAIIGGMRYIKVLIKNIKEGPNHGELVNLTTMAVVEKIICEDAAELVLEYFYVDKYIVENQPWYLVMKDIITAFIYILPLVKIFRSRHKDYKAVSDKEDDNRSHFEYVFWTPVRVSMSFAMVFRVVGMIMQYSGSTIDKECFKVENGTLVQTPFTTGCLHWCDWFVLVSLGSILFVPFISFSIMTPHMDRRDLSEEGEPSDS